MLITHWFPMDFHDPIRTLRGRRPTKLAPAPAAAARPAASSSHHGGNGGFNGPNMGRESEPVLTQKNGDIIDIMER